MHLGLAISWFFKLLSQGEAAFAEAPGRPAVAPAAPAPSAPLAPVPAPAPKPVFTASPAPAVQMLGLLQKEGRLIDFLQEDVSGYSDEEIGAAVRDIHRQCRATLSKVAKLRRVLPGAEGSTVSVAEGFDPSQIELQGNVAAKAPLRGRLLHGGWYVEELKLPTAPESADPMVVQPAQVEVS